MTQINVIHEVGDSQNDCSDSDSGSDDDNVPVTTSNEGGEATTDTDSLFFSRPTLW